MGGGGGEGGGGPLTSLMHVNGLQIPVPGNYHVGNSL